MDKELASYRDLMQTPTSFDEGFSWPAVVGALFIGIVMVPGAMYMQLLAGIGVGPAAQWVTVILFIEVARRAHTSLKQAQIFTLFYMAGAVMSAPFENLLWAQFFVQSEAVTGQGLRSMMPEWYAPTDPRVLAERNFFSVVWLPAIGLVIFKTVLSRIDNNVLGYGLFKLTSDMEKLPFPMAPIGAQGIVALAEDLEENETKTTSWRWRAFSIGGALGLGFGAVYLGIPTLSGAILGQTIQPLPIPFADWTGRTQDVLPAFATGLSFDLGQLVIGMVIPFWAVVGAFFGLIVTMFLNPILYKHEVLTLWQPGDSTVETLFKNNVDFYFSFGIGISLAIAIIGISSIVSSVRRARKFKNNPQSIQIPPDRGDIPFKGVVAVYLVSTLLYIGVCGYLIDWHRGVMVVLFIYGFLYTPIISYVTARLEGMVGQALSIPLVREAGIILSGYQGVACWFLPFPIHNYGERTMFYRKAELTGTRFTSIWKSDIFLVPFIILCSILFAQLIWNMGPIPSSAFPYTEEIWEFQAKNQVLLYSSTTGGYSEFHQAVKPDIIGYGTLFGLGLAGVLWLFSAPSMLLYGAVQGLNQSMPHAIVPQMIGALLGRFYFERRLGVKSWRQYAPVVSAGFFCGAGLITMFCIGVQFLSKSVIELPY